MIADKDGNILAIPAYDLGIDMTTARLRKRRKGCKRHTTFTTVVISSKELAEIGAKALRNLLGGGL